MKKRIGNDISFTWHIYRKSGEEQVPESFTGKDVEVKLISPLQRPVTIEDVSIATGVVTFTFRGKHQVTLGNYVAVLLENKGEDGMVTLDVVNAVTLVAHSYMEEDGDDGDVIEAEAVELTSTISAGGGGGIEQQQADWAQTDASAVDFIKNKPNLGLYLQRTDDDGHSNMSIYSPGSIMMILSDEQGFVNQTGSFWAGGWSVSSPDGKFQTFGNSIYRGTIGFDQDSVVWEKTATQQIPAATTSSPGLMSAEDKGKLDDLPTDAELTQELGGKANTADLAEVATSGSYNDLTDKPTIQDLAVLKYLYALDNTNPDYPSMRGAYVKLHKTCSFGAISIVNITPEGVEERFTDVIAQNYPEATITIDNTTYTSYRYNNKYYMGLRVPFFVANVAQYGHNLTLGVLKFIATQNGVFKVHAGGVTPSTCIITVNGVNTTSLRQDLVAVQVNTGDVVKVIPTSTTSNYVRVIGFVLEGSCGVSMFNNDAGYITASDVADKQDKMLIVQVASGTTAINAAVNTYYEVAGEVGTLAITLPTPTDLTKVSMVVIHLTAGTTPNVVIDSTAVIDYSAAYDISAGNEYEINCLFNGDKWVVADMEVV